MYTDNLQSPDGRRSGGETNEVPFRAVLTPYRSLSATGFVILMCAVGAVSFVAGLAFLMMGAWPVFGFFGLDVLLIYLAFQLNYRSGRKSETIEIDQARFILTRTDERGHSTNIELNPYWASVRLHQSPDGRTRLAVASHGRQHPVGQFLTDEERSTLALALHEALLSARGAPRS